MNGPPVCGRQESVGMFQGQQHGAVRLLEKGLPGWFF